MYYMYTTVEESEWACICTGILWGIKMFIVEIYAPMNIHNNIDSDTDWNGKVIYVYSNMYMPLTKELKRRYEPF
jgi:hypothetical protein